MLPAPSGVQPRRTLPGEAQAAPSSTAGPPGAVCAAGRRGGMAGIICCDLYLTHQGEQIPPGILTSLRQRSGTSRPRNTSQQSKPYNIHFADWNFPSCCFTPDGKATHETSFLKLSSNATNPAEFKDKANIPSLNYRGFWLVKSALKDLVISTLLFLAFVSFLPHLGQLLHLWRNLNELT